MKCRPCVIGTSRFRIVVFASLLVSIGCENGVNHGLPSISGKFRTEFDYVSEFGKSKRLDRYYFENDAFIRYSIDANNYYRTVNADTSLDIGKASGSFEFGADTLFLRIKKYSFKSFPAFADIDPDTILFSDTSKVDLVTKHKVVRRTETSIALEAVFGGEMDTILYSKY